MADRSKIEWTDATWNPLRARNKQTGKIGHFCVHASEGCRHCYAERLQPRFQNPIRYAAQDRSKVDLFLDEKALTQPLRWRRPRMVFVCSMTDLFGDWVEDEWIDQIFAVMALCPQHTFQVLTKRPERMRSYLEGAQDRIEALAFDLMDYRQGRERAEQWFHNQHLWPLPHAWLGTSVEDQKTADLRIPELLATPAAVRWISAEPLLGPVDLVLPDADECYCDQETRAFFGAAMPGPLASSHAEPCPHSRRLDWVVAGGESGRNARPMHPDWARSLRDQCAVAGIPFLLKQWGEWVPWQPDAAPCWKSQDGRIEDRHTLFPADVDADPRWDDGLPYVAGGESHATFQRVGKRAAGRRLDGQVHDGFPSMGETA